MNRSSSEVETIKQKPIFVVSLLFSCSTHPPEAQLIQHWRKDMAGGRHLVDFRRKLKRMNLKRLKRKDSPVRLYKKCIRMHTKLQRPRDPERKQS